MHYGNNKTFTLKFGGKRIFKNFNGTWLTLDDVSFQDAVHKFAEPCTYDKEICEQREFDVMGGDTSGKHFTSLLAHNKNIKVNTGDGR